MQRPTIEAAQFFGNKQSGQVALFIATRYRPEMATEKEHPQLLDYTDILF
jgi:hypothetical protein